MSNKATVTIPEGALFLTIRSEILKPAMNVVKINVVNELNKNSLQIPKLMMIEQHLKNSKDKNIPDPVYGSSLEKANERKLHTKKLLTCYFL